MKRARRQFKRDIRKQFITAETITIGDIFQLDHCVHRFCFACVTLLCLSAAQVAIDTALLTGTFAAA
jgi:hypothetical protein